MKKEIPFKYNKKYWNLMVRQNQKTAELINSVRWGFVKNINSKVVLDYGAGPDFLSKYAPKGTIVDTFDIGDFPIRYTGIRHKKYDLTFFCDVLEHIPDFGALTDVFKNTKHVYVSVPILPKGRSLKNWRHNKFSTGEHLHFFTKDSLDLFFAVRGFKRIKAGYPEVDCNVRKDIYSVLYKKL